MSTDLRDNPAVFIYVRGGVVQDVDCPEGVSYRVVDYDNELEPQFKAARWVGGVFIASEQFYDLASCYAYLEGYGGHVSIRTDGDNWEPISDEGRVLL